MPLQFNPDRQGYDSPLAGLDTSQYQYSSFIYPMDLGVPGAGKDHYMIFHINETATTQFQTQTLNGQMPHDPATVNANQANSQARQDAAAAAGNTDQNGDSTDSQNGGQASQPATGAGQMYRPIQRVPTTIVLYMNDVNVAYGANWTNTNLGAAKETVELFKNGSFKNFLESGLASGAKHLGDITHQWTDMNFNDTLSLGSRLIINNHLEVIFNGIDFRQFNFSWRFTPESEAEALNVDNIIRAFKFYSAPEILTGWSGRFWIYPAEFDIQYIANGKENEFLNKISTCVLTNMEVNYTPTGHWSAFREHQALPGAPSVITDLKLSFMEVELMTKERILEGY